MYRTLPIIPHFPWHTGRRAISLQTGGRFSLAGGPSEPIQGTTMTTAALPRRNLLLHLNIQALEEILMEFDHGDGVYFYDRKGRRYLDFLAEIFNCNLGHGNRRVIDAIRKQAEKSCCVTPVFMTEERVQLAEALSKRTPGDLNKC